jgi:uncharacterized protein with PIN domain
MKFVADVMLGKLAKRMRLLGFDVAYDRNATDNDLIRVSLEQDRVILTRDSGLARRPLASCHLFIESDNHDEQLRQVIKTFTGESTGKLTRCSVCNGRLSSAKGEAVRDIVPSYIHQKYRSFMKCETCNRVYWEGTHLQKMMLNSIREK